MDWASFGPASPCGGSIFSERQFVKANTCKANSSSDTTELPFPKHGILGKVPIPWRPLFKASYSQREGCKHFF